MTQIGGFPFESPFSSLRFRVVMGVDAQEISGEAMAPAVDESAGLLPFPFAVLLPLQPPRVPTLGERVVARDLRRRRSYGSPPLPLRGAPPS